MLEGEEENAEEGLWEQETDERVYVEPIFDSPNYEWYIHPVLFLVALLDPFLHMWPSILLIHPTFTSLFLENSRYAAMIQGIYVQSLTLHHPNIPLLL